MLRLFAILSMAVLCGCGSSSNRVATEASSSQKIGVSKPYTLVPWKSRCVGGTCGTYRTSETPVATNALPPIKGAPVTSPAPVAEAPAQPAEPIPPMPTKTVKTTTVEVVELPPSSPGAAPGTRTITTTTIVSPREIRRPRNLAP